MIGAEDRVWKAACYRVKQPNGNGNKMAVGADKISVEPLEGLLIQARVISLSGRVKPRSKARICRLAISLILSDLRDICTRGIMDAREVPISNDSGQLRTFQPFGCVIRHGLGRWHTHYAGR